MEAEFSSSHAKMSNVVLRTTYVLACLVITFLFLELFID